ncbi:hypothetical protein [Agaribacter marinus]|uniref:Uncharacterized protein n=1 Tax=Agaribacter marinus TaxID=1431249 RepID=A0AA37WKD5_9ALTE|nr:hypothetical protein [Agaribacter marinus]GLR71389.1 hypothetical protein GCM10007852_22970 [Agaribacter marinus]
MKKEILKYLTRLHFIGLSAYCYADVVNANEKIFTWRIVNEQENIISTPIKVLDSLGIKLAHGERAEWLGDLPENFHLSLEIKAKVMAGIGFYSKGRHEFEYLFFRTSNDSPSRAIQYLPVYNGAFAWHLYSDYQYPAAINSNDFFGVELTCSTDACEVVVNAADQAKFNLSRNEFNTGLFFRAFQGDAVIRNVEVSPTPRRIVNEPVQAKAGMIQYWELSQQVDLPSNVNIGKIWRSLSNVNDKPWKKVRPDKAGIVNISKYFEHPKGAVFAKTCLQATQDGSVTLKFDYSHVLTVLLNGQIIFSGRELDTHNFFRISHDEESIELPVTKGQNELSFLIHGYDLSHLPPIFDRTQYANWGYVARTDGAIAVSPCNQG